MNKLDELIVKLCPDEVEYKRIGEIFDLKNGYTPSKKNPNFWKDGTIPWFTLNDIRTNGRILNDALQHVAKEAVKGGNLVPKNSIIMSTTATIGEHALIKIDALTNQQITSFSLKPLYIEKVNIMFAFYYFYVYGEWCKKNSNQNGGMSIISLEKLRTFEFPLPPLPVQQEIVRILDNFTGLISELNAELDARRKQYEYYRKELLAFEDDVPKVKLCDISQYSKDRIDAKELNSNTYVGVDNLLPNKSGKTISNYVPTHGTCIKYNEGDILIGNIRPYLKKIWLATNTGGTNGDVLVIQLTDKRVISKYLYYLLSSDDFFVYDMKHSKGVKMPRGNKDSIMHYTIPLPNIKEQERIVSILDRFDALCYDTTCGLPAEIAARQKQYEYYRDKLLTFKRKNA